MHIDGACHCGSVTFTAEIDPSRVMVCHCTDCQVLSGSPFRAIVAASIERFAVNGLTKSYVKTAQSGRRFFVPSAVPRCMRRRRRMQPRSSFVSDV
jgi:hypothetical protein